MDLRISLKSQLYALREIIIISIIYCGLAFFLYLNVDFSAFKILFLATFFFYFFALLLHVLILHINYLNNCTKERVIVELNKLTIGKNVFVENDINVINIYATSQHFSDSVGVSASAYNDYYYYVEINLKNGKKINLSSLLDYKIDKLIKENFNSIEIKEYPSNFLLLLIK